MKDGKAGITLHNSPVKHFKTDILNLFLHLNWLFFFLLSSAASFHIASPEAK